MIEVNYDQIMFTINKTNSEPVIGGISNPNNAVIFKPLQYHTFTDMILYRTNPDWIQYLLLNR